MLHLVILGESNHSTESVDHIGDCHEDVDAADWRKKQDY
jgi:hypothetical protein